MKSSKICARSLLLLIPISLIGCSQTAPMILPSPEATVREVVVEVCTEFEQVDMEAITRHLNLDTLVEDAASVEQFRILERNERRRISCANAGRR